LVVAAYIQLRLARARVADMRLPWERRYDRGRLTPVRVHRVVSSLLVEMGTPAKAPKPCGRSPGRPKGRPDLVDQGFRQSDRVTTTAPTGDATTYCVESESASGNIFHMEESGGGVQDDG